MEAQTPVTQHVARRVRQLRTLYEWSTQLLSDRCVAAGSHTLTRSTLAKIECGSRKSLTVEELYALAVALNVEFAELLPPYPL